MAFCDCATTYPVHAYPVAGDADWHTGLAWHSMYKQETQIMQKEIERLKLMRARQKKIIKYQKFKAEQEKMNHVTDDGTITETNTRTSIRKEEQKLNALISELRNADKTDNTIIEKCEELQKHFLLYVFYYQESGVFGDEPKNRNATLTSDCLYELRHRMNEEDFEKLRKQIFQIDILLAKRIFEPYT